MNKDDQALSQLYDLQREVMANSHKIKFYDQSIVALKRNSEKCKISIKELENIQGQNKTFKPLGKAFILKERSQIQNDLLETIKNNEKEVVEQQKFRQHFESKQKEMEKQLKEVLATLKPT